MTKRFWSLSVGVAALVAVIGTSVSAQQQQAPPLPTPTVAQMPPVDKYVVGAARPPVVPGAAMLDLTLEQAQQIALEKNLDLQVQKMNPAIQDYSMVQARAAYRPTFSGSFNQQHNQSASTNVLDGVTTNNINQSQSYSSGVTERLKFWGASVSATFSSGRSTNNSANSSRNPSLSASTKFSYSQSLLANRAIDSTRNGIRTREISRQTTDITLLATIENTKASVRTAYWALRQAIESIEIQVRTLAQAQQLLDNTKIQVTIGTVAGIDVAQPEVSVANAEQGVLNARIAWQQAELAFKRLLVNGKDDDLYRRTINPVDQALLGGEPSVNIDGAVQGALANRTDIQIARKNIQSSEMSLEVTKNATLPTLDLSASYSLSGTGGPQLSKGQIIAPGGYFQALGTLTNAPSWTAGLSFSYPLGMTANKASLASSQVSLEQSKAQLKVTELTIATDVTNAGLSVQNSYQSYLASKKAREAQEKATEAEVTRFNVGMSNTYNVVQQQNNLTQSRLTELRALISYINAVADFEKKQRIGG